MNRKRPRTWSHASGQKKLSYIYEKGWFNRFASALHFSSWFTGVSPATALPQARYRWFPPPCGRDGRVPRKNFRYLRFSDESNGNRWIASSARTPLEYAEYRASAQRRVTCYSFRSNAALVVVGSIKENATRAPIATAIRSVAIIACIV